MPGLYLPKSHTDHQRQKEAELVADWYTKSTPDFSDAMELQRRLQMRDVRLSVVWGSAGPHMNRWVILRTAEDGQQHVVKVFQNRAGEYERPEPSTAERLISVTGAFGDRLIREMDAQRLREEAAQERHNAAMMEEMGDRLASDILRSQGVKDRAAITTAIPKESLV